VDSLKKVVCILLVVVFFISFITSLLFGFPFRFRFGKRIYVHENVTKNAHIKVFGTEYIPNDEGRVFLQLLDQDYQPIDNGVCLLDLYYPDRTIWFREAPMLYQEGSKGIYYFDFIVPNITGVYMVTVECLYVMNKQIDLADSFALQYGTVVDGDYTDTWYEDGHYHWVREDWVSGYRLSFYYEFDNITEPENYNGMAIVWKGNWDQRNEYVEMYIYDWCNDAWFNLPNRISYYTSMVSNYVSNDTIPFDCIVQGGSGGSLRVGFQDSAGDWSRSNLRTDLLEIQAMHTVYGQLNCIRGGGEVHVSKLYQMVNVSIGNLTVNYTGVPSLNIQT